MINSLWVPFSIIFPLSRTIILSDPSIVETSEGSLRVYFKNGNEPQANINGYDNLIYQTDKYGFRENIDFRYIYSDYVLLGDSFTKSICENKPKDLKSDNFGDYNSELSFFHNKVCSANANLSDVEEIFRKCDVPPSIIAITETKLNTNTPIPYLDGYMSLKMLRHVPL